MSQRRSRVEKYAQLRDEIIKESNETIETKELSSYAQKLHQVDDEHFENMEVGEVSNHHPLHLRDTNYDHYSIEEDLFNDFDEEKMDELYEKSSEELIEDTDSFRNDYLKDFIEEAKQYNVEKGFRIDHDTKSNLLRELNLQKKNTPEPSELDFSLEEEDVIETLDDQDLLEAQADAERKKLEAQEIARQQQEEAFKLEEESVFDETELEEDNLERDELEDSIMLRVAELAGTEMSEEDYYDTLQRAQIKQEDLLEQTTKLQMRLDEQNEVVSDMNSRIEKTNKSMNILLGIVITFLVALILLFVFIFLKIYEVI